MELAELKELKTVGLNTSPIASDSTEETRSGIEKMQKKGRAEIFSKDILDESYKQEQVKKTTPVTFANIMQMMPFFGPKAELSTESASADESSSIEPISAIPSIQMPHPIQNTALKDALDNNILLSPPKVQSEEETEEIVDFEKFMTEVLQYLMDTDQEKGLMAREALQHIQSRKEEIVKDLQKLGLDIKSNEKITLFLGGVQIVTTVSTLALAFVCPWVLGVAVPAVVSGGVGFLGAWTTAFKMFFQGKMDKQRMASIDLNLNQNLCEQDLKKNMKEMSENFADWNRLFGELCQFLADNNKVKKMMLR